MSGYRNAGVCLIAVAAAFGLTGCGSGGGAQSASASTSATVTSTASTSAAATFTGQAAAPPGGGTATTGAVGASTSVGAASDAGFGVGMATGACHTWATGMNLDSATRSTTVSAAARQAGKAAEQDGKWARLAKEMGFVSALPETGNSTPDQQQAMADEQDISGECAALGVTVGN